jgi:hypothetical protein
MKNILPFLLLIPCSLFLTPISAQTINTVFGNGIQGYSGDGGQATAAELNYPEYAAIDGAGNVFFSDDQNYVVRRVNTSGIISTVAGIGGFNGYTGDGGPATAAELNFPFGLTFDANGNMYIGDTYNEAIRKVNSSGVINTIVGNGVLGYSGDGGPATAAELQYPMGVTFDSHGNMFIADQGNNVIREVNTSGIINTVVGNSHYGYYGDGGPATIAELESPSALVFDANGNMYIADTFNRMVRQVNTSGYIHGFAGKGGVIGYSGDGGPATAAELYGPYGMAFDASGTLYISDGNDNVIRTVDQTGTIHTFAGNGVAGYSGDGGLATAAELQNPTSVVFDASGNLYITDDANYVVREITGIPEGLNYLSRKAENVSIYPNPSNGKFTIQESGARIQNPEIEIYNMLGEKVFSKFTTDNSQLTINLNDQPAGIYLYRIITETGNLVSTGKLVIQK